MILHGVDRLSAFGCVGESAHVAVVAQHQSGPRETVVILDEEDMRILDDPGPVSRIGCGSRSGWVKCALGGDVTFGKMGILTA